MDNKKRLFVLGGFPQMIDIIALAHEMGVYVVVVDRELHSPSKRFADKAYDVSTDDIDKLAEICRLERIDGIFTGFEDFNIHIAAELSEKLGLPFYATKKQLSIVTDKTLFKKECRKYQVPVIEEYTYADAVKEKKYPYIVKPTDSYGSRGITVCRNEEQLGSGYEKAVRSSRSNKAIIERFIDYNHGVELFYTIVDGKIHLTATADRYTFRNGDTTVPLPVAEVFPSRHRGELASSLDAAIRDMLFGLELKNGLVLLQALYDGHDYYVYEMAYRLTGEQHYRLVARQHGINLGKMMIKLALGETISEFDTDKINDIAFIKPSINLAVILNSGTIDHIQGLEKVFKIEEVVSYNLTHFEKDTVSPSGDYSHLLIRINMVADNYEHLKRAVEEVNDYIEVRSNDGADMISMRFHLPEVE